MKTTLPLLALFILILGGGYYASTHKTQDVSNAPSAAVTSTETTSTTTTTTVTTPSSATQPTPTTPTSGASSYTLAQVSAHATSKSCWSAISGNVYDLTSWISQHPGGEARILSICGKDGTSMFDGQHGSDPRALSILATFKIGTLAS